MGVVIEDHADDARVTIKQRAARSAAHHVIGAGNVEHCVAVEAGAWWTILGPITITILLLKVSGVTMLESLKLVSEGKIKITPDVLVQSGGDASTVDALAATLLRQSQGTPAAAPAK